MVRSGQIRFGGFTGAWLAWVRSRGGRKRFGVVLDGAGGWLGVMACARTTDGGIEEAAYRVRAMRGRWRGWSGGVGVVAMVVVVMMVVVMGGMRSG